jgi:hypothetical protein
MYLKCSDARPSIWAFRWVLVSTSEHEGSHSKPQKTHDSLPRANCASVHASSSPNVMAIVRESIAFVLNPSSICGRQVRWLLPRRANTHLAEHSVVQERAGRRE